MSGEEILKLLLERMGATGISPRVDKKLFRPSDAPELYGDSSLLHSDVGWNPTISVRDTIYDFVERSRAK
jgi:GDP-D-mannose dehydratase